MRVVVLLTMVAVASAALNATEANNKTEALNIAMVRSNKCHIYDPEQCHSCAKDKMKDCMECMMEDDKCCLDPHKGHSWMKQHSQDYCKKWLKK
ncbi:unnamed protein product [Schistocephalus solidus]|uniref:Secreted protein n=1 Tax=Schistocephalus solidus TaxID=70667 RepID=A0A183TGH6_SCHSO|nr:unnamed protein product [Schistocephalus solidus]